MYQASELHNVMNNRFQSPKQVILLPFSLFLVKFSLYLISKSHTSLPKIYASSLKSTNTKTCDIFSGNWVPYLGGPHYTNESSCLIIDEQNCIKFGRPDREFLKWRWKPDECELPLFNASQFLTFVSGKSMIFVGDSVGRNQMESLMCLLSNVAHPEDTSLRYTSDAHFKRWFYTDYNFTLGTFWPPFLVRASEVDPKGHSYNSLTNLYLDEVDLAWANEIANFDYIIISAGQWFFHKMVFYENGQVVGYFRCEQNNITNTTNYYGFRKVFHTAFRTLMSLKGYKGVTFFRTFSPIHFENGAWNDEEGNCERTRPFTKEETRLDGYLLEVYLTQVEEFKAAEKKTKKKGLQFWLLDTTEIMLLRPDGHPNKYGHAFDRNMAVNDCIHWCLPGPIDTWNEFLLYMMNTEYRTSSISTLEKPVLGH